MSAHQLPASSLSSSHLIFFQPFPGEKKQHNEQRLFPSLPLHLLCCHSFHCSQHLPLAFHLWCTAGGFVTLSASVPVRKICLSRCKHVSKGSIQFFPPHRGEYFYGCGFYEIQEVNWTQFLLGSEKRINPGAKAKM